MVERGRRAFGVETRSHRLCSSTEEPRPSDRLDHAAAMIHILATALTDNVVDEFCE
jgi:hypothetical protein